MVISVLVSEIVSPVCLVTGMNGLSTEVAYINIVEGWFNGPRLMTPKGRMIWTGELKTQNIRWFVAQRRC